MAFKTNSSCPLIKPTDKVVLVTQVTQVVQVVQVVRVEHFGLAGIPDFDFEGRADQQARRTTSDSPHCEGRTG